MNTTVAGDGERRRGYSFKFADTTPLMRFDLLVVCPSLLLALVAIEAYAWPAAVLAGRVMPPLGAGVFFAHW